ncbi:hypothetical protein [uncultured Cellulomonas sp.]|uniref:hypothetical protein n=1 Tax=uncultured Cellulomonas sp. TaxID=189682 RepID=UPI002634F1CD|nr:hypothetical protein [uncultured Cellulomonas sp.]
MTDQDRARPRRGGGRLLWLLPVVTFALGVLLGGLGAGVGVEGDVDAGVGPAAGEVTASPDPSPDPVPGAAEPPEPTPAAPDPSPAPGASAGAPDPCLEVARQAEQLAAIVRDAAAAAGQLDAARLSDVVRQLEESQLDLDALSERCRVVSARVP